jgi:hypothetical protein
MNDLTLYNRALFEKIVSYQLVIKFRAFYATTVFIAVPTTALY